MNFKENVKSQFLSALEMLRQAVVKCPDSLWNDTTYRNTFWRLSYHALFYTHFYLHPCPEAFVPWGKSRRGYDDLVPGGDPYTKAEILEYCEFCGVQAEQLVEADDLEAPSGFHWLPFNRLEAHIYNIRHLQSHTGELCERLGVTNEIEVDWVIKKDG